ncbi:hypothetical protein NDU88_003086 [Pleurodeles waltl]|uniref:Uncharacterized protein n=1 Tax=Pleurodeles waltl TaxID=8319 RepID=A0AAV7VCE2_PLEWA|nr:hypothetical protein NDU88_003086 [Pleurodeles waltl]
MAWCAVQEQSRSRGRVQMRAVLTQTTFDSGTNSGTDIRQGQSNSAIPLVRSFQIKYRAESDHFHQSLERAYKPEKLQLSNDLLSAPATFNLKNLKWCQIGIVAVMEEV